MNLVRLHETSCVPKYFMDLVYMFIHTRKMPPWGKGGACLLRAVGCPGLFSEHLLCTGPWLGFTCLCSPKSLGPAGVIERKLLANDWLMCLGFFSMEKKQRGLGRDGPGWGLGGPLQGWHVCANIWGWVLWVPPRKVSSKPRNLRMWPYLETVFTEVIKVN